MQGYIQVTEEYFLKRNECVPIFYDVFKKKTTEKYPEGKMSDIAYGCELSYALHLISHAVSEAEDIVTLAEEISNNYKDFVTKVQRMITQK